MKGTEKKYYRNTKNISEQHKEEQSQKRREFYQEHKEEINRKRREKRQQAREEQDQ